MKTKILYKQNKNKFSKNFLNNQNYLLSSYQVDKYNLYLNQHYNIFNIDDCWMIEKKKIDSYDWELNTVFNIWKMVIIILVFIFFNTIVWLIYSLLFTILFTLFFYFISKVFLYLIKLWKKRNIRNYWGIILKYFIDKDYIIYIKK